MLLSRAIKNEEFLKVLGFFLERDIKYDYHSLYRESIYTS